MQILNITLTNYFFIKLLAFVSVFLHLGMQSMGNFTIWELCLLQDLRVVLNRHLRASRAAEQHYSAVSKIDSKFGPSMQTKPFVMLGSVTGYQA